MSQVDPIEFGRVIGHLEALHMEIKELKERTVWRLDNVENRVEALEKYRAAAETPRLADKLAEKLVWGVLGAVGVVALKSLHLV